MLQELLFHYVLSFVKAAKFIMSKLGTAAKTIIFLTKKLQQELLCPTPF